MHVTTPDGWTLRAVGGPVPPELVGRVLPATVPGCVHLDLLAAGVIPDPYLDDNEEALRWVGEVDWEYSGTLGAAPDADVHELVAEGLDTFATVELNGVELGRTRNMHRTHRFDAGPALVAGTNTVTVTFEAARGATERASAELGPRPHVNAHPFNAARKMACSYGWDWGPDLVTAGIWKPLHLESWSGARLAGVRPLVDVDGTDGVLDLHADVVAGPAAPDGLEVVVAIAGVEHAAAVPAGGGPVHVRLTVPDARLWWPHGYGDQPHYPVQVSLRSGAGELDGWAGRVGFRTVDLDTTPDEHGVPFRIRVNGTTVLVRGVNWIPDDAFPVRVGPERYAERLTQARDAHVNLVRIWGGGIYEADALYETCDELGLLVWQDFLFACAAYAEEEPMRSEVEAEAREAVTRLSPHPSLVLWNGCNENLWGHEDWDWKDDLDGRTWGAGYYTELLPAIVRELDPTRPYTPGSPFSVTPGVHPNDPADGTLHVWDVWNERDYTAYRDYDARFVAEFGFQGPPAWSTLVEAVHDEPLRPDSPGLLVHQKAEDGQEKLRRGLAGHLPEPERIEDWHWATSLNQARAVRFGIEHFRSRWPVCSGTVVWQLNDCWPVVSWSAVDGRGRLKPLWYALRAAYRDRLLTVQPRGEGLAVVVLNDTDRPWSGSVAVARHGLDGSVLASADLPYDVPARGSATLAVPADVAGPEKPAAEVLRARAGEEQAWWHFVEDVDAELPVPELDCRVEPTATGVRLHVTAGSFVRDLALLADRIEPDAVVDDMLVTLLPGESVALDVRTGAAPSLTELTDPRVLRCSNQLATAPTVPATPEPA